MRFNYFIAPLILSTSSAFTQTEDLSRHIYFSQPAVSKNTIVASYSNEADSLSQLKISTRTVDYPTQVIRIKGNLTSKITCDDVNDKVQEMILDHISGDKFTYNAYLGCTYDPDTHLATSFFIHSYFDPLTDHAVDFLNDYLAEYNGIDFLDTKLNIESAQALVISLNIAAGVMKKPNTPPFIQYRQDHSNFYFSSNYEMRKVLFTDIYQNFFSNDPEKILPFLNKWVFYYADKVYKQILKDSNYVDLQPERIFLMNNGDKIFVSNLKYYFGHNCQKYDNHHCLPAEA